MLLFSKNFLMTCFIINIDLEVIWQVSHPHSWFVQNTMSCPAHSADQVNHCLSYLAAAKHGSRKCCFFRVISRDWSVCNSRQGKEVGQPSHELQRNNSGCRDWHLFIIGSFTVVHCKCPSNSHMLPSVMWTAFTNTASSHDCYQHICMHTIQMHQTMVQNCPCTVIYNKIYVCNIVNVHCLKPANVH